MPRELPTGIRRRRGKLFAVYRGPDGKQVEELAGTEVRKAVRYRKARMQEVAEGTWQPRGRRGMPTVATYAKTWLKRRVLEVRSGSDDERWLRLHVLPRIGHIRLDALTPQHVAKLVGELRADMGAKSVRNAHGALSAMLSAARFEGLIMDNPAKGLPRGVLPRVGRRKKPPFPLGEALALMTDDRIPQDRRVLVAMCCLTGMRPGEAVGRRWRDISEGHPLPRLHVHSQYQDAPMKGARDEYTAERLVPIHPTLVAILDDWYATGWNARFGRVPRMDDFIVPDHRDLRRARTRNQYSKALTRDQQRCGLDPSFAMHSGRRFFITQARQGGAEKDVIDRITHDPKGDIIDLYTHWEWQALCKAVSCIRLEMTDASVLPLQGAGHDAGQVAGQGTESPFKIGGGAGNRTPRRALRGEKTARVLRLKAFCGFSKTPEKDSGATSVLGMPSMQRCSDCGGVLAGVFCADCGLPTGDIAARVEASEEAG